MSSYITINRQKHIALLADHRHDPTTKELLKVGDQVCVCAHCKVVHLRQVWVNCKECPSCRMFKKQLRKIPNAGKIEGKIKIFEIIKETIKFSASKESFFRDEVILLNWDYENCKTISLVTPSKTYNNITHREDNFKIAINENISNFKCSLEITDLFGDKIEPIHLNIPIYPAISINEFKVSKRSISKNEMVTVFWNVENFEKIILFVNDQSYEVTSVNEFSFYPTTSTILYLKVFSYKSVKSILTNRIDVQLFKPIKIDFTSSQKVIISGSKITLKWTVKNAKEILLISSKKILRKLPSHGTLTVDPEQGNYYILRAVNDIEESEARIDIKILSRPEIKEIKLPESPHLNIIFPSKAINIDTDEVLTKIKTISKPYRLFSFKTLNNVLSIFKMKISHFLLSEIDRKNIYNLISRIQTNNKYVFNLLKSIKTIYK